MTNLIADTTRLLPCDLRLMGDLSSGSTPIDAALERFPGRITMIDHAVHHPVHDTGLGRTLLPRGQPVTIGFAAAGTDPL